MIIRKERIKYRLIAWMFMMLAIAVLAQDAEKGDCKEKSIRQQKEAGHEGHKR
jgi:hypothetical protein